MAHEEISIVKRLEAAGREPPRVRLGEATPAGLARDDVVLRRNGRYEILGEVAEGGVGEVLRGRDVDLGRDVALKVLKEQRKDDAEILQRFVDEAQIGAQLQHPGIVPVYELGLQDDNRPFFAMKLVKGHTLAGLLHRSKDSKRERRRFLQVFEQVCQTVAYAHARGVVHRDLKPANVMVGSFGEVQVLDWGFAKVLARGGIADERTTKEPDVTEIATLRSGGEGSHSVAGSIMGTPAYMPPEQAMGLVDKLDERSDVFSLGAILCEILTGKPPYVGEDKIVKAAQARLDDAHERLTSCGANETLIALTRRCLAPLRANRPTEASEVAEGVHAHLAAVEDRARQGRLRAAEEHAASKRAREEATAQRKARKQTRWLGAALMLAIVVGTGGYAWIEGRRRDARERTHAAITSALEQAHALEGKDRLGEALAAAEKATLLSADASVDATTRDRATSLHAELETLAARAAAKAAAQERDAAFLALLHGARESRLLRSDRALHVEARGPLFALSNLDEYDDRLRAVFAKREIGIGDGTPAPLAAARLRERHPAILEELAVVLDEWAGLNWLRAEKGGTPPSLLWLIATALDPDPTRGKLREAVAAEEVGVLRSLAADSALADQPPRTLDLLQMALDALGYADEAIEVGELGVALHPTDVVLRHHFLGLLGRVGRWEAYVRHEMAQIALRPDEPQKRVNLSGALLSELQRPGEALAVANAAARRWPDDPGLLQIAALALSDLGRHEDALVRFHRLTELEPEEPVHFQNVGFTYGRLGRSAESLEAYRHGLALDPDSKELRIGLLKRLASTGHFDEALRHCEIVLQAHPDDLDAWEMRVLSLGEALRFDQALKVSEEMVRRYPDHADAWARRGIVLRASGKPAEALRALERARSLDPDGPPWVVSAQISALKEAGHSERARQMLDEALREHPGDVNLLEVRAWSRQESGDADGALADIGQALRLKPWLAKSHQTHGNILAAADRRPEALEAYREAARLAPGHWVHHQNIAVSLSALGRHAEAESVVRKALELDGERGSVLDLLAQVLRELDRLPEALATNRKAIVLDPGAWSLHHGLGHTLSRMGDDRGALDAELEAMRLAPDKLGPRINAVTSLTRLGRSEEAETMARESVRRHEEAADAWGSLAGTLQQRRPEEALACFRRALALDPELPKGRVNLVRFLYVAQEYDEALEVIEPLVRERPEDFDVRQQLANILAAMEKLDEAMVQARALIRMQPDRMEGPAAVALVHTQRREFDEAETLLKGLIADHPDSAWAYAQLGRLHVLRDGTGLDRAAAIALFEQALERDPAEMTARGLHPAVAANHAAALYQAKRFEEAVTAARRAIGLRASNAILSQFLGAALIALGRFEEAIAPSRESIRLGPAVPSSHWNLAVSLHQTGRWRQALDAYERLLEVAPENPLSAGAAANRGALLAMAGRLPEAIESFRTALKLQPTQPLAHMYLWWLLNNTGRPEEALAAAEDARKHHPATWWARGNVANALTGLGRHDEALEIARAVERDADALPAAQRPAMRQWLGPFLERTAAFTETARRLPALLAGTVQPKDARERVRIGGLHQIRKQDLRAAEAFEQALRDDPALADDLDYMPLLAAASSAARLGTGVGRGGGTGDLTGEEMVRWRQQAYEHIVAQFQRIMAAPQQVQQHVPTWLHDPDFAGVRDEDPLAKLPAEEREQWTDFWKDVRAAFEHTLPPEPK